MGGKRGARTRENLNSYVDFLSWCRQAGLLESDQAEVLARHASRKRQEATGVLAQAIGVREALYRVFAAIIENKTVAKGDLKTLNSELAVTLGRLRVSPEGKHSFGWSWAQDQALDQPLGPVVRAAAHLLTDHARLHQLRRCNGDNCGWLFLDSSKNHSRRWCDMGDCGNRAKVRRHRLKQRCAC
jgi:predicted RNA-binding Zn ribbon-like protein